MKKQPPESDGMSADIVALRISEERLTRSHEFANIGTWDWDIVSNELYWSERIWPLFGYDREIVDMTYDNFVGAIHPDDRQAVQDAVQSCLEQDAAYSIEHRVIWPDGSVHWVKEDGGVVRAANGNPVRMVGVVQDIDERKRTELALADSERMLREAQKIAQIGSWQADLISGELVWSDQIYDIFGYEIGSFKPSVQAFHAAVHPDDLALVHESEKRAELTGYHDVVHRIIRSDGAVRYVHELARAENNAAGNMIRLTGTVQDVTERMRIEHALLNAKEEAEKASLAKSEFLSCMSHELRTPLNAILGFGQLLDMKSDDRFSDNDKDYIREILHGGRHLLELINDILDLSRIEAGHMDIAVEKIRLNEVLSVCITMIQPLADQQDIQLYSTVDPEVGVLVHVDSRRFKQVILNLLSNAVKYNHAGGTVTLSTLLLAAGTIRVMVQDTGLGMDLDHQKHLFEPFVRSASSKIKVSGTGIGLVITKRLVEAMGGSIGFDSTPGRGSRFWVDVPVAKTGVTLGGGDASANSGTQEAPRS